MNTRKSISDMSTRRSFGSMLSSVAPRFGMLGLIIFLVIIFSVLRPTSFGTPQNAKTILVENSVLMVLALAVMIPLVVSEFDLSLASVLGLAAMLTIGLPTRQGLAPWLTVLIVLAMGVAIGAIHALLIVKVGLPSFVVTLGSNSILLGVILLYSGGAVIYESLPESLAFLGTGNLLGVAMPVVIVALLVAVLWFILQKRPLGRLFYAVGANATAARLAGVNTGRVKTTALILAPVIASIAGLLLTARIGSANPTSFSNYFLPAFAAAFLSLAAFQLGKYNPLGVIAAVILLAVGVSGLMSLGVPSWVENVFNGTALIAAIGLARMTSGSSLRISPP